ncbi:hypothetical protein H4219_002158 [Mycoemilia scoparia]|uniref:Lipoyl-binding domain-containing protein n=1 Tax=Mycoemilia scoparia TaxID=417184 RepID=A0A9W8DUE0_9FUNG|nr:hypothetical protein H4219_002158 [Mycoemilia scoparia]
MYDFKISEGDPVEEDQIVGEGEVLKNELKLRSHKSGIVDKVFAKEGEWYEAGHPLFSLR